ncbi:37S ribosomal protein S9, mitochondrial, partial [Coemansia erecta]
GEKKKKKRPDLKACGRDELGRWFGGGRRKAARARAWLIPIPGPDPFKAMMWAAMNEVDAVAGEVEMIMRDVGLLSVSDELEKPDAEPATDADAADADAGAADAGADAAGAPRLDVPEPQFTTFGEVLVNGKPLADYFMRATDRESVIFPLVVSNKLGRYNAFVQVHGGGPTGQAEACQLAVARALYRSGRREHGAIKTAKLLIADHRMVERKKTGKPKARKSYTWVKR